MKNKDLFVSRIPLTEDEIKLINEYIKATIIDKGAELTLKGVRVAKGLTLKQVAGRINWKPMKVYRIETGYTPASFKDLKELALAYNLSLHEIVDIYERSENVFNKKKKNIL